MTEGHSPCTAPACETCKRWRAYGLLAQVAQAFYRNYMMGSREWGFEDEEIERYQQVASETYWQNLDAVALLATEHARLEADYRAVIASHNAMAQDLCVPNWDHV